MKLHLYYLLLFLALQLLSSCAMMLNKTTTQVDVHTKSPAFVVLNNDTVETIENTAAFLVERSNYPLKIAIIRDSISKIFDVKPKLSLAFYNNFFFTYGFPGAIIDLQSNKRFTYPEHLYEKPNNSKKSYSTFGQYNHKGELYLNFSIPEFNFIHQHTVFEGYKQNNGCMGISVGMDYYYKPLQFVNISGTIALSFEAPIPLPLEYFGPHEAANSKYISISNNHWLNFISIGYGLSFSQNIWRYFNYNSWGWGSPYTITKKNYALGLAFPLYIRITPRLYLGYIYRPSFYRPYSSIPFKYEHLMSVDFAWKFRIKRN